jgi:hypothetical protein
MRGEGITAQISGQPKVQKKRDEISYLSMAQMNSDNKGASWTQSCFKIGFSPLTSTEEYLQVRDGEFDITPQSKHSALSKDSNINMKYT